MALTSVSQGGLVRQTWRTPRDLFDRLHGAFQFTVDGCADPDTALLPRFWTDCLAEDWRPETVFLNPPFRLSKLLLARAAQAQGACVLLPMTCLTTLYFGESPPPVLLVPNRRIRFDPPVGLPGVGKNPSLGTVVLLYGTCAVDADRVDLGTPHHTFRR